MSEDQPKRIYEISNIYLKDASFESPQVPDHFAEKPAPPNIDIEVNVQTRALDEDRTIFECVLLLKVTAQASEKTIFLVDISQAGIVKISGFADADLEKLLHVAVPNSLLPFARETIASLISKGGFPQLLISPLNFEHIYNEKLKAQQEKLQGQQAEH